MPTKLEEIAAKARRKPSLQFTSLCHHVTKERVWKCLQHISAKSAPGIDGIEVNEAKENFENWIQPMLQAVHRKGYKAPPVRRVWIPKPGKATEKRPLGVPCIADRALQRSVSQVLSAIYEEDFLPCSFGGRPKLSAHHALSTLNEIIAGKKVGWVYEAYLVRYIDDFVVCFQYCSDAKRYQQVLTKRLAKFSLALEPNKTRLVKFGRFAQRDAKKWNRKVETIYFLGFTHYCTRNRKGNFMVGRKTEKSRLKRSLKKLRELMRDIRHYQVKEQVGIINQVLRGHYGYYGLGGNHRSLWAVYRHAEKYWYKMLKSRCRKSNMTWDKFAKLKKYYPLQLPTLKLSFYQMQEVAVL